MRTTVFLRRLITDDVANGEAVLRLMGDNRGVTAIEYGLIVALIVIAMIAGLQLFASSAVNMWNGVQQNVAANG